MAPQGTNVSRLFCFCFPWDLYRRAVECFWKERFWLPRLASLGLVIADQVWQLPRPCPLMPTRFCPLMPTDDEQKLTASPIYWSAVNTINLWQVILTRFCSSSPSGESFWLLWLCLFDPIKSIWMLEYVQPATFGRSLQDTQWSKYSWLKQFSRRLQLFSTQFSE